MAKDDAFKSSFINRKADLEVDKLFRACVKLKASDLHLKVDKPPMVRVDGTLRPMNRGPPSPERADDDANDEENAEDRHDPVLSDVFEHQVVARRKPADLRGRLQVVGNKTGPDAEQERMSEPSELEGVQPKAVGHAEDFCWVQRAKPQRQVDGEGD